MTQHKQSGATPTRMLLWAAALALLLLPLTANAVTITIYGSGGVHIWPPSICPDASTNHCVDITFDSEDPYNVFVQDAGSANQYQAILGTPATPDSQGGDLDIVSITPIE